MNVALGEGIKVLTSKVRARDPIGFVLLDSIIDLASCRNSKQSSSFSSHRLNRLRRVCNNTPLNLPLPRLRLMRNEVEQLRMGRNANMSVSYCVEVVPLGSCWILWNILWWPPWKWIEVSMIWSLFHDPTWTVSSSSSFLSENDSAQDVSGFR